MLVMFYCDLNREQNFEIHKKRQFDEKDRSGPVLFQVDRLWPQNNGEMKIHGRLLSGIIKQGEGLRIGPDQCGKFYNCSVQHIKVRF